MKKYMTAAFAVFLTMTLTLTVQADPDLLFRGEVIPGAEETAVKPGEKVLLTPEFAAAGTCSFWIRPDGWDQTDNAWHFFVVGGKHSKDNPYIVMFRLPAGKVRMVWCKDQEKKEVTDIFSDVPFRSGEWNHFAFTWQDDSKGCVIRLYINGKLTAGRRTAFQMKNDFPLEWFFGDVPRYRPYSKFKSTLGRIELYKRALSADEIAALAAQKFIDGRMSFVSRKFIPGSVNRIHGKCAGEAVKLEAVFADEAGKEELKALPFS